MIPYEERPIDSQYHDLLQRIMDDGRGIHPIQGKLDGSGEQAKMLTLQTLRFDLRNGFPLITERDLSGNMLKGALGEHFAFLHGARTLSEMRKWGCGWWEPWVTAAKCKIFGLEQGDLGDGSYGVAWTKFPHADGSTINQIADVLASVKLAAENERFIRTFKISNWIPGAIIPGQGRKRRTVVAPCHGDIQIMIYPETREVEILHTQRSADVPVGLAFNIIQYAAFGMMVAHLIGYKLPVLSYAINDAHIYERQFDAVETLLSRAPRRFPTMPLKPQGDIKTIFDFRPRDFVLGEDYNPHPPMRIPTPI